MIDPSLWLRRAILADAVVSGATALLLATAAGWLASLLNLPDALLRESGQFLIVYAALVGWLGTRPAMPAAAVWTVVVGNTAWVIGSVALLVSRAVAPNLLGEAFVVLQAVVVGVLAELQYIGLRKSTAALKV